MYNGIHPQISIKSHRTKKNTTVGDQFITLSVHRCLQRDWGVIDWRVNQRVAVAAAAAAAEDSAYDTAVTPTCGIAVWPGDGQILIKSQVVREKECVVRS